MISFNDIELNNKEPVYIQLCTYIKQRILLGNVRSKDTFPSRREIAASLGINPNTVQKAFKLMEDEGFVITQGNQGSILYLDEKILNKIEHELTNKMVKEFIISSKAVGLSFKQTIDLISSLWDEK